MKRIIFFIVFVIVFSAVVPAVEARHRDNDYDPGYNPRWSMDSDDPAEPFHAMDEEDMEDFEESTYKSPHGAIPFTDIKEYVYKGAILYVNDNNIVQGYPDKTYRPTTSISRAEFIKILIGAKLLRDPSGDADDCFADVKPEDWWSSFVCYAKERDLVNGYPDGTFRPSALITFKEAAKMLVNTFDIPFKQDRRHEWYYQYIYALSDRYFIPSSVWNIDYLLTRGEMAEMIWRIKENVRTQDVNYANIILHFDRASRDQYIIQQTAPMACATAEELTYIEFPIKNLRTGLDDTHKLRVHKDVADVLTTAFTKIFQTGFPIDPNTTLGFSCRKVSGTDRISQHGVGKAVDINAEINPMVASDGTVLVGSSYDPSLLGTITEDSVVFKEFKAIGWKWGGLYKDTKDYMHFSSNGW